MFRGRVVGLARLGRPGLVMLVLSLMVSGTASAFAFVALPKARFAAQSGATALGDHYATMASRALNFRADKGVLANDSDSQGYGLAVDALDGAPGAPPLRGRSAGGAWVTLGAKGSFSYNPAGSGMLRSLGRGQTVDDTFTYGVSDGHGGAAVGTVTIAVMGTNKPPVLGNVEPSAASYGAATLAVPVSSSLTVGDRDDEHLSGATVSIISGLSPGEDSLSFTDEKGIAGRYDPSTGVLTLSGSASLADYQAALRSVSYSDTNGSSPTTGARTISFQVDDGHRLRNLSNVVSRVIQVNPNPPPIAVDDFSSTDKNTAIDIPVLANDSDRDGDTVTSEGGSQVLPYAIQQNQSVVDNQPIQIRANSLSGSQSLLCDGSSSPTSATAMYDLQVNGCPVTQVNPGGTVCPATQLSPPSCLWEFGEVDESYGFDAGHVYRFESGSSWGSGISCTNPTPIPTNDYAQYQATGTVPAGDPRAITVYIVPDGSFSNTSHLIPILGYAQFYAAGWDHDPCIDKSDPNSPDGRHVGAVWGYVTGVSRSLTIASVETTALRGSVSTNPDGTIHYAPAGAFTDLQEGQTATDTFTYKASDGYNLSSPTTVTITIHGTNDPPTLSNIETTALSYTAGTPAAPVTSALCVTDDDDTNLEGATVSIASGFVAGEDSLSFANKNGINGSYDPTTGILTLTGTASPADYQAALQSVSYSDTNSTTPTAGTRTITFQVNDGHAANNLSNTASRQIQVN